jgi:hypothetical protein
MSRELDTGEISRDELDSLIHRVFAGMGIRGNGASPSPVPDTPRTGAVATPSRSGVSGVDRAGGAGDGEPVAGGVGPAADVDDPEEVAADAPRPDPDLPSTAAPDPVDVADLEPDGGGRHSDAASSSGVGSGRDWNSDRESAERHESPDLDLF